MIKSVLRTTWPAKRLVQSVSFGFSNKLAPQQMPLEEEKMQTMDWRAIMELERRNVMKNYD